MLAASLSHVTKTYGTGPLAVAAADDASLDILANRLTVLSGPSGSGKTTLLNLLGGIDRPTRGAITVAGQRIDAMRENALADFRARHVGFVFQSFNLLPVFSAFENVEYPLTLLDVARGIQRPDGSPAVEIFFNVDGHADVREYRELLSAARHHLMAGMIFVGVTPRLRQAPLLHETRVPKVLICKNGSAVISGLGVPPSS